MTRWGYNKRMEHKKERWWDESLEEEDSINGEDWAVLEGYYSEE